MNRKEQLLEFLNGVGEDQFFAIYYQDKTLGFNHFAVWQSISSVLLDVELVMNKLNDNLENNLFQVLDWQKADCKETLVDYYETEICKGEK